MTTTWSARAMASSRSWVTKMTDGRVWSHSCRSSFDMIALVCTSSAPNGSSISRIEGSLINEPSILLMDEPFGALDVQTKAIMSNELLQLWDQTRPSVIFVTHDLEEAIALADQVVVMTAGPGTVKAVFDVDLPRPRGAVQEIRFDSRFLELHHQIWASLREEVEAAYTRTSQGERS